MNARNRAESTEQSRFPPPCIEFALSVPRAQVAFSSESSCNLLCATILDIRSTSCAYCSHFGARVRRRHKLRACSSPPQAARDRARAAAGPSIFWRHASQSLPIGPSSRRRLLLLASHRMALTRERKNPSRIAREIEIFSIFAWLVLTLVPKQNSRFWVFRRTISWTWWSIDIYEILGRNLVERISQFPCGMLFLRFAQKQDQIWGSRFSSIVGFRSLNFAQRWTLVHWNRINRHFGFWEMKYWELEFQPLGNENSPFCRTEWFHIHIKIAFFHLSFWLIGQGGWKFRSRLGFNSWQFTAQAEKWRWARNAKICNCFLFFLN